MTGDNPAFRFEGATLDYTTRASGVVRAVDGIDWEVAAGTSVAVVGRSGSGKSSLLALLALMRRPTAGTVEVLGHDVSVLTGTDAATMRATSIGVVFQGFHLDVGETVWWNVALPWVFCGGSELRQARRRAQQLLELVGLEGLDRRRAAELSGGQRQRVAVARALMSAPKLLVADEPTGNLDEATANQVADLVFGLTAQGMTVVVVTHDREVAARADSLAHLQAGRLTGPSGT